HRDEPDYDSEEVVSERIVDPKGRRMTVPKSDHVRPGAPNGPTSPTPPGGDGAPKPQNGSSAKPTSGGYAATPAAKPTPGRPPAPFWRTGSSKPGRRVTKATPVPRAGSSRWSAAARA